MEVEIDVSEKHKDDEDFENAEHDGEELQSQPVNGHLSQLEFLFMFGFIHFLFLFRVFEKNKI
jgi:hypothetical protein